MLPQKEMSPTSAQVIAATRRWIEIAVIGLNLCPFAAGVYHSPALQLVYCDCEDETSLLRALREQLDNMRDANPAQIESSLLIHPGVLTDFLAYNDFLAEVDALLVQMNLAGVIQIASFHPDYQFADTAPDDITNFTNRSPYPMLHLLRERSVERAIDGVADTNQIVQRNMATMRALGHAGWRALWEEKVQD